CLYACVGSWLIPGWSLCRRWSNPRGVRTHFCLCFRFNHWLPPGDYWFPYYSLLVDEAHLFVIGPVATAGGSVAPTGGPVASTSGPAPSTGSSVASAGEPFGSIYAANAVTPLSKCCRGG
ncbi:hypothetical protein CLU79DRAFT_749216, partial [Phycomyces nitens]